ncbi:MAG: ribosomal protein S18-alanine N-acetyltransferase [Deltaproteobacteria bacterium]|nr:ribosomal protein S18-alanine N-acetyltransferase [Deltaproteobacteria bacterium]
MIIASPIVRLAKVGDAASLAALDALCLSGTWSDADFVDELQKSFVRIWVCTLGDRVTAYVHCWLVADEAQVLNVATDPSRQRQGHARRVLEFAFATLRAQGCVAALLEVRAANTPAIALYRSLGFSDDGVRNRYYSDGQDALLMSLRWM